MLKKLASQLHMGYNLSITLELLWNMNVQRTLLQHCYFKDLEVGKTMVNLWTVFRKVAAIEGTGDAACVLVQKIEEHCLQFVGQLRKLTTSLNIAGRLSKTVFE